MYKITPTNGEPQIVNSKHIIYGKKKDYYRHTYNDFTITAEDYYNLIKDAPRKSDGYKLIKSNSIYFNHQNVPIDPYLFGFWLGDGNSDKFRFTSNDIEIWEYLKEVALKENLEYRETLCTNTKSCKHIYLSNHNKINPLWSKFRTLGVVNNKHIPNIYKFNSREILLQLLAGLIDSDGTYNKKKHEVQFTQYEGREQLVHDFAYICRSLGMRVSEDVRISKERILDGKIIKGGVKQYRCSILYGHSEIPTKILRKQTTDRDNSKDRMACTFKIEPYKIDKYYGFSLTGNQLFLLKDFTICHNSWPSWKKAYLQGEALVEDQGSKFGIRLAWGKNLSVPSYSVKSR